MTTFTPIPGSGATLGAGVATGFAASACGGFGQGGAEPYARAFSELSIPALRLVVAHDKVGGPSDCATSSTLTEPSLDLVSERWGDRADAVDRSLVAGAHGPVLDIGCGPARMVRAAMELGLPTLGIDILPAAVARARREGLSVLQRNIFDPLPLTGHWELVLVLDENIGIGGDPDALLTRCRELISPRGTVVVETHPDPHRDETFVARVEDAEGRSSDPFPWALIGSAALTGRATGCGFAKARAWSVAGRHFVELSSH